VAEEIVRRFEHQLAEIAAARRVQKIGQELSGDVACLIGRGGLLWQRQFALVVEKRPRST
jgi:hypothetical protein